MQRDLAHAAYLALALFLFRRREQLRLRGNGLFVVLLLATFSFLAALLLFQAPASIFASRRVRASLNDDAGRQLGSSGEEVGAHCTVAHLLGLHTIDGIGHWRALSMSVHGAGLPLLTWLAVQVRHASCTVLETCARFSQVGDQLVMAFAKCTVTPQLRHCVCIGVQRMRNTTKHG